MPMRNFASGRTVLVDQQFCRREDIAIIVQGLLVSSRPTLQRRQVLAQFLERSAHLDQSPLLLTGWQLLMSASFDESNLLSNA